MLEENIKTDKEGLTIFFDTRFYPAAAILKASELFTKDFWLLVDGNKNEKMFVKIKPKKGKMESKEVGLEFYNFVLSVIREKDF